MQLDKPFYIYRHIRPDTEEVFYVGKGTFTKRHKFDRAFSKDSRNIRWQRIVAKNNGDFVVEIMLHCPTESVAFEKEKEFIKLYRRTLCNMTDGGEGSFGLPVSLERRKRYSVLFTGSGHPRWGKKSSAETCRKKSVAISGSKHFLYGKQLPLAWKKNISEARKQTNGMRGKFGAAHHLHRKVVDGSTNAVYFGVAEASRITGLNYKTIYNMLSGHRLNRTALRFA